MADVDVTLEWTSDENVAPVAATRVVNDHVGACPHVGRMAVVVPPLMLVLV